MNNYFSLAESNTKRNIGDEIIKGMEKAIGHMRGQKTCVVVHELEISDDIVLRAIKEK